MARNTLQERQYQKRASQDVVTHKFVVKDSEGKWLYWANGDNIIAIKRLEDYSIDRSIDIQKYVKNKT